MQLAQLGHQHQVAHVRDERGEALQRGSSASLRRSGFFERSPAASTCSSRLASRSAATRKMRRWRASTP